MAIGNTKLTSPRTIAIVLAIGGFLWGVLLLLVLGPSVFVYLPLTASYLLTAGYIVRAVSLPPLKVRCFIWSASILVQLAWLIWTLPEVVREANPADSLLQIAWWLFAVIASVMALVGEK